MPKSPLWTNHDTIRELRVQVTRLEAANAAKDAALRAELAKHVKEGHWAEVTEPKPETCAHCKDLLAALSDTAGEGVKSPSREAVDRQYREQGWLPPEVREQDLKDALEIKAHWKADAAEQRALVEGTRESHRQRIMNLDCHYGNGLVAPRQRCGMGDFRRGNCQRHYLEAVLERGIAVYRALAPAEAQEEGDR